MSSSSTSKRVLTPQEKRQWERVVLDLNAIFPAMTLKELAQFVRENDGSFDNTLTAIMARNDGTQEGLDNGQITPSAVDVETSLELNATSQLIRLRAQYGHLMPTITAVIGEGTQDDLTILQALESAKGDSQEAVLSLLSLPERFSESHSELSSSRNALRQSASSISASASLRSSSGLEELPINVNLAQLDSFPNPMSQYTSSSPTPIPVSSSYAAPSFHLRVPYPSPASSAPSETSVVSSLASSPGLAMYHEAPEDCETACNTSDGHESDTIVYEFSDEDDDDWSEAPGYEGAREVVFGTDFIAQMLQEEYDHIIAMQLAKDWAEGKPDTAYVPQGPLNSRPYDHLSQEERDNLLKRRHEAIHGTGSASLPWNPFVVPASPAHAAPSAPPAPSNSSAHHPLFILKKKQRPSGPKYYERVPDSSYSALVVDDVKDIAEEIDQSLIKQFLKEHTTVEGPASGVRQDIMPVIKAIPDEFIKIAGTIKQIKDLYQARLAAIEAEKNSKTRKPVSVASKEGSEPLATSETSPSLGQSDMSQSAASEASSAPSDFEHTESAALFDITAVLERLFASVAPKSTAQCLEIQQDEIRLLKSIFIDRVHVSESVPTILSIALKEPSFEISRPVGLASARGEDLSHITKIVSFANSLYLHLVVALPPLYPEISPSISVRTLTPNCPVQARELNRLETFLREKAKKAHGSALLSDLVVAAEEWLCADVEVRKAALLDFGKQHEVPTGFNATSSNIFTSLDRIFSFGQGYSIIDSSDALNQRDKLLKRAIAVLINGPGVVNPPTLGNPDPAKEFPVVDLSTGKIDEEASLRGLGLTVGAVRVILQHYNWNIGRLSTSYLASLSNGSYETFLSESGVAPVADRYAMQHHLPKALTEIMECPTCLDTLPFHNMFGLVCGHMMCKDCYSRYVDAEVSRGAGLSSLLCPSPGCKYVVDQVSIAGLLPASRWSQFVNMAVSQFVQVNPSLSWCPSTKGCGRIVQLGSLDSDGISAVLSGLQVEPAPTVPQVLRGGSADPSKVPLVIQCKCSYTFCNGCARLGGHFPATCTECDSWDKAHPTDVPIRDHNYDNFLSEEFVRSHTRGCPKCSAAISKNGGCVHMMCTACRHEFCWVCFGDWTVKHYACSEKRLQSGAGPIEFEVKGSTKSFDSLLGRHRNFSYSVISKLRQKLTTAMYRTSQVDQKKLVGANAVNNKHLALEKAITIEDVPPFIEALEILHVAHYILTNACKAGYALVAAEISTTNEKYSLSSLIHRGLEDIRFLTFSFDQDTLKRQHVFQVNAGIAPLKTTIKLIVDHLDKIRLAHLSHLVSS